MIAKIGSGSGFGGLVRYLVSGKRHGEADPDRVAWACCRNLPSDDPREAAIVMRATASLNERVAEPVYHVSLSLPPGERLTREQWEGAADRVLSDLGLKGRQALLVAHGDTEHAHVHLVVNRVHPDTNEVWDRWQDRPRIADTLRAIERQHHLKCVPTGKSPLALPDGVVREFERTGRVPILEYAREVMPSALKSDLVRDWSSFHEHLSRRGLFLDRKGQGLVVTNDERQTKASAVARDFSLKRLEERFGPFVARGDKSPGILHAIQFERRADELTSKLEGLHQLRWKLGGVIAEWEHLHKPKIREAEARLNSTIARVYRAPERAAERIREALHEGRPLSGDDWDRIGRMQGFGLGSNWPLSKSREAAVSARVRLDRDVERYAAVVTTDGRLQAEMETLRAEIRKSEALHGRELRELESLQLGRTARQQQLGLQLHSLRPREISELSRVEPGRLGAVEYPGWAQQSQYLATPPAHSVLVTRLNAVLSRRGVAPPQGQIGLWIQGAIRSGAQPVHVIQAAARFSGLSQAVGAFQSLAKGQNPLLVAGQMVMRAAGVPSSALVALGWVGRAAKLLIDRGHDQGRSR